MKAETGEPGREIPITALARMILKWFETVIKAGDYTQGWDWGMTKNCNEGRMKAAAINPEDLIENDWLFFDLLYQSMPESRPAKVVGDLIGRSENTTIRWGRAPLSDEEPNGTGSRSPLAVTRMILRHIANWRNPELVQAWIESLQIDLDRAQAELAREAVERIQDPGIRESALRDMQRNRRTVLEGVRSK